MNEIYDNLIFATLLPVFATCVFVLLNKTKYFDRIPYMVKQAIFGIAFGLIAVWGTENGIPYNGAVINVRDGAVLTAGLVFGAPAGIIAGLIGGIERYFAVYWGVGSYTQIACSVSTAFAGFLSAALRKQMFDDETPGFAMSLAIGIVMEVFHLSMVFVTNMSGVEKAMSVVKTCSLPMIPTNGLAVMLSSVVGNYFGEEKKEESKVKTISELIQFGLLIAVIAIFLFTTSFNFRMQTEITNSQIKSQLTQAMNDVVADVEDATSDGLSDIAEEISAAVSNKHVGTTGYVLVADKNLAIVGSSSEHRHEFISDYGLDPNAPADTLNDGVVDGEEVKFIYTEVDGYYIISILPIEEGYKVRSVATYVNVFMEIMAYAILFVLVYNMIKVVVVANINRTNTSLARIIDGDLDEVVDVKDTSEFIELSNDINLTVDRLKEFINEAKARIDAEIQYAKNIQESALPHAFPNDNKYEIFALMEAAKGVGGDFYDFYKTTRHGVNFMIADVSGKGIPGAMFMMRAKAELHTLTETGIPVNEVFTYGNERLCEGNDAGMFVTAWEGNINLETGQVRFANAGHNPPVIMRTDGTVEYIRGKAGFVLAGMEGVKYQLQELQMNEGDVIFLYTDGVVEATNKDSELYGEDRLINCLKRIDLSTVTMDYLCCEVIGDVGQFVGDAEQFDDITMLALKYKGNHENEDHSLSKTNMYTLGGGTGI